MDKQDNLSEASQSTSTSTLPSKPFSQICKAVDVVKRAMDKLNVRLHRGYIYTKAPEGKYAFVKSLTADSFLHTLLRNTHIADQLAPQMKMVSTILSFKGCQIVPQLEINYDLIEVKPFGTCFSFETKGFIQNAMEESDIGEQPIRHIIFQEAKNSSFLIDEMKTETSILRFNTFCQNLTSTFNIFITLIVFLFCFQFCMFWTGPSLRTVHRC